MDPVSLIVGIIGGLWAVYVFHRKIQVENILQERTEWRAEIRELASCIVKNPNRKDIAALRVRLNPNDKLDNDIIDTAECLYRNNNYLFRRIFLNNVARLLKYDWERAKNETQFVGFFRKLDENSIRRNGYKSYRYNLCNLLIFTLFVMFLLSVLIVFGIKWFFYLRDIFGYYFY